MMLRTITIVIVALLAWPLCPQVGATGGPDEEIMDCLREAAPFLGMQYIIYSEERGGELSIRIEIVSENIETDPYEQAEIEQDLNIAVRDRGVDDGLSSINGYMNGYHYIVYFELSDPDVVIRYIVAKNYIHQVAEGKYIRNGLDDLVHWITVNLDPVWTFFITTE